MTSTVNPIHPKKWYIAKQESDYLSHSVIYKTDNRQKKLSIFEISHLPFHRLCNEESRLLEEYSWSKSYDGKREKLKLSIERGMFTSKLPKRLQSFILSTLSAARKIPPSHAEDYQIFYEFIREKNQARRQIVEEPIGGKKKSSIKVHFHPIAQVAIVPKDSIHPEIMINIDTNFSDRSQKYFRKAGQKNVAGIAVSVLNKNIKQMTRDQHYMKMGPQSLISKNYTN